MILFEQGAIDKGGFNGPYVDSTRQKGFVSYGASHVMRILGSAEVAQRSSWYHKWNVHMYARPEVRRYYLTFVGEKNGRRWGFNRRKPNFDYHLSRALHHSNTKRVLLLRLRVKPSPFLCVLSS